MTTEDIVSYAKNNNMPVAALTDFHSLSALPDFLKLCYENGIHGIAGLTIQILDNKKPLGDMVLLGKGGKGFASLRKILDVAGYVGLDIKFNEQRGIELSDVLAGKLKGDFENCIMLDGAPGSIGEALIKKAGIDGNVQAVKTMANDEQSTLGKIKSQFGEGDYLGVQTPAAKSVLAHAIAIPTSGDDGEQRLNVLESTLGYARDDEQMAQTMQWFKSYAKEYLEGLGESVPINAMIKAKFSGSTLSASGKPYTPSDPPFMGAEHLIAKCPVPRIFKMQPESLPLKGGDELLLKPTVADAWRNFVKTLPAEKVEVYRNRLLEELSVIGHCGFEDYFINILKIQKLAEADGNSLMLRGSGAASLVMHVLNLSPVDPMPEKLLFKRFLDEDRIEDPDVDIEFSDPDGIRQSIERNVDAGQMAYLSSDDGISKPQTLFEMAKDAMLNFYPMNDVRAKDVETSFKRLTANKRVKDMGDWKADFDKKTSVEKRTPAMNTLISIASEFDNAGLRSSISPGSVVFIPDGVGRYFSLLRAQKNKLIEGDAPRIALTKHNLLSTGHIKYDLLSNRSFTRAMNAWKILGLPKEMKMDLKDPAIAFVFKREAFMGVNQVSGWVGSRMAKEFKPRNFNELTAINALIRDGGDDSTIKQYLYFKDNPEKVNLAAPINEILGDTYGSMLYEEQLMLMLTDVGGFTWSEADRFRSSLKKGKGNVIDDYEAGFIAHASKEFKVSEAEASKWYQPLRDKRGKFVFNKAHAVAYAHVAVRQCWLKAHYPATYAAELFCDDNVNFAGEKVVLQGICNDWQTLFPKVGRNGQNAQDFVRNVAEILLREEGDPNSKYKRNPNTLQAKLKESIEAGQLDFALPLEWERARLLQFSDAVFKRLDDRGYEPITHAKIKRAEKRGETIYRPGQNKKTMSDEKVLGNQRISVGKSKGRIKPANQRGELIDWEGKVMIGHVLDFFQSEGVVTGLDVDATKASALDHYRFSLKDDQGKLHNFHVAGISTDPVRAANRDPKYSLASGFYQGGAKDKGRASGVEIAMSIVKLTGYGDLKFPYRESKNIPGSYYLMNPHKKRFEGALSKVVRQAKSPLYDSESGGIVATYAPSEPTSPVMVEISQSTRTRGMKKMAELFEQSRHISIAGMQDQLLNGNFSIAEVYTDKLTKGYKGNDTPSRKRFTEVIANYQKVDSVTPLYEQPMIKNNQISPGGHQRFMTDRQKGRTTKMDLGFTTKRVRGHTCGKVTPGAETLWMGEAAMDTLSFNELQSDIQQLNKQKGLNLPFAEANSVAVRSAGGAEDVIKAMLDVEIIVVQSDKAGIPTQIDFQKVKRQDVFGDFEEGQISSAHRWFMSRTIHFLKQDTPENYEAQRKLTAIMHHFDMSDDDIRQVVKVHDYIPSKTFNDNVGNVYKNIKADNESFLHDSNMQTWLRGSDLLVKQDQNGDYEVGFHIKEAVPVGPKFSEMDDLQKSELRTELQRQFIHLSGARSLGLALDNDGAGLKDAVKVELFCVDVGIPVGRLMPEEKKNVPFLIDGKERKFDLKDHNDYLMLRRELQKHGQHELADKVLVDYAETIELPNLGFDDPDLANRLQGPK
jgi:hypothetical protein